MEVLQRPPVHPTIHQVETTTTQQLRPAITRKSSTVHQELHTLQSHISRMLEATKLEQFPQVLTMPPLRTVGQVQATKQARLP